MTLYVIYVLLALNVAILGWLIFLTAKYKYLRKKAEIIFDDDNPQKIAEMLKRYFENIETVNNNHQKLQKILRKTKETAEQGLHKVSFIRYNPFGDVGSDQSFSLCLLNNHLDGFVISSIHSREGTRVYAKSVKAGSSSYNLSKEEEKVINMALKKEVLSEEKENSKK